ncbi:MAG: DUF1850 domain-containing protein [Clostridia bacterium]
MYSAQIYNSILQRTSPGRRKFTRPLSAISIFAVIFAFSIVVLFFPVARKFVLIEEKTGKVLYYTDIKPYDTFTVTYTHSVNKSPVDDVFEIQPDYSIMVKKTIYRSFGAGVPYEIDKGQVLNIYDDRMEIDNINLPLEKYLLFVGTIAEHKLMIHEQEIYLDQLTQPQQTVRFEVRKIPIHILIRRGLS